MLLALIGFVTGAALGAIRAHHLGGKPADIAQYAFGCGIPLGVIGLLASVILYRLAA